MSQPDASEAWVEPIFDAAMSHALASGWFAAVNGHEPRSAPGHGLTCALWVQHVGPAPAESGLTSTTALLILQQRIFTSMLQDPPDAIDPAMLAASSALIRAYSGDFDLGGQIRCVDLLGITGRTLQANAGYVEQDAGIYRVMTLTIPCIVNDVWAQGS